MDWLMSVTPIRTMVVQTMLEMCVQIQQVV